MAITNITSINSQPLKPAMSFKGDAATEEKTIQPKEGMTQNEKIGWGVGGAAAIAATIWGIVAARKGKVDPKVKQEGEQVADAVINKAEKKLYQQYENIKAKYNGEQIVKEFEQMRKPEDLKTYAKTRQELSKVDWDAQPMTREELYASLNV